MDRHKLTIPLSADVSTSAILTLPSKGKRVSGTGVIAAHGAGNDMDNPLIAAFTDGLAGAGYPAMRFNFLYREKGLKTPDRPEKLEAAWTAACRCFLEHPGAGAKRIIAAGKSMGGRIASQMAAEKKLPAAGLIFLGYPLHPADDPSKIRDAHLYRIGVPMLFFAGTRDSLCDLAKLRAVLSRLSSPRDLEVIEGGDHSFHIPEAFGIKASDTYTRILNRTLQWLEQTTDQG